MKIIAGLGNPGREYQNTPHNAGFMVVEELASKFNSKFRRSLRFSATTCKCVIEGETVLLVKPATFMNNSDRAVVPIMRKHGLTHNDLIVAMDDADLEPGRLRIRKSGSSGGHKGLSSILTALGTEDVIRVRIGIGRADSPLKDYVLSPIQDELLTKMQQSIKLAADAICCIISFGVEFAMNKYNSISI